MPKSSKCACGIRTKVHARKSRRGQLPGLKTDRRGNSRPGRRAEKDEQKWACGCVSQRDGTTRMCADCYLEIYGKTQGNF